MYKIVKTQYTIQKMMCWSDVHRQTQNECILSLLIARSHLTSELKNITLHLCGFAFIYAEIKSKSSCAEPDSYWHAEDGFNDGRVELYKQLLWQVALPQLAKEVQSLLGLFHNGLNVIVPLRVLRNYGAQESEWLHWSHSAVHNGE